MFRKVGYSSSELTPLSSEAVLADPIIVERMTKLAHEIRSIAPKSDDFLYFSIIFLKAAESALIDEKGDLKKVGRERAWGYFDENWRWHGNVRPHKNNNSDIFPESELKKAARDWIGKPLCKDHISDSVDGIRGIILDTHYDEKLKQVVGLCALDRINYADLAKKVETGIVRYGSMGTAVEVSVCSECGNKAKTAKEYCDHVTKRSAWGEINVGLKPIEYSLVVQPAESGAVLLKCIASLKSYRDEFINYGVDNFEEMLGSLSSDQAQHLNTIVKTACGDDGCSITERKKIITSFLTKNNLLKVASEDAPVVQGSPQHMESFTSGQTTNPITGLVGSDDFDVKDYTGASGSLVASPSEPNEFQAGGVIPDNTWDANAAVSKFASEEDYNFNKSMLSSVLEDIMYESSLKKRAELRRKLAYHQGGADKAVEPATFKKEMFSFEEDKQMHQDGKMGGAQGSFPGDQELKGKLSRAQLEERRLRRLAYFQGASEGVEPKTFKAEPFPFDEDKQMHQDGKMGGDKGMFPGDQQLKEKMKRASYEGPALSTKLSWELSPSGQLNKSAALFEVFAGDRKVIAATGSEIFGDEISQNWDWFTSKEYGQEVCKQIRASGLNHVTMLLKGAQAMPPAPPMGQDAAPPAPPMPPMPPMPAAASEAPEMPEMSEEGDDSPKKTVEDALVSIEEAVAKARDALGKIEGGGKVTVNIDAEKGDADVESGGEEVKLSREISQQLKVALAELDESADELAMIAETYENAHRLSSEHVADLNKIARDSLRDADRVLGQTSALTKMASSFASVMTKTAKVVYAEDYQTMADDSSDMTPDEVGDMSSDMHSILGQADDSDDDVQDLVSMAMDLRRARREEILVQAAKKKVPAKAVPAKPSKSKVKVEEKEEEEAPKAAKKMKPADKAEKPAEESDEPKAKKSDDAKDKKTASLKEIVSEAFSAKKADQDREVYKLKLRRAFDVALEMQKKGLIGISKTALDKQVDDIMDFDDRAFEAFKRSVANAKSISSVKIATDLGGVNVGVESSEQSPSKSSSEILKMLWE